MPRDITAAMQAHLESGFTTLAMCWHITRTDGQVFTYTTHDASIVYDGVTYKAVDSGDPSATRMSLGVKPDNSDLMLILDESNISEEDLRSGLFDYADLKTFMINYEDTGMGIIKLAAGKLGRVIIKDEQATQEFNSLADLLNVPLQKTILPTCDATFGDTRCGQELSGSNIQTGLTITSVTDNQTFQATGNSQGDSWYPYGNITWQSGENDGLTEDVKLGTTSGVLVDITLTRPMPYTIAVGDTFNAVVGCDKSRETCRDTFANYATNGGLRFRGFPDLPGAMSILRYETYA